MYQNKFKSYKKELIIKSKVNNTDRIGTIFYNSLENNKLIKKENNITLKYKIKKNDNNNQDNQDIQIFGIFFVKNNKKKCIFIKNNKINRLRDKINEAINTEKDQIKIKLRLIDNLYDLSSMFKDCSLLLYISDNFKNFKIIKKLKNYLMVVHH